MKVNLTRCGSSASTDGDVLERDLVGGLALLQEHLPGEDDVVGGDRDAVGEFRLGPQVEDHPAAVLGVFQALGDQAVGGVGLVGRAGEQAVVEQAEALRRLALQDEGVEAVEGLAAAGAAEAHGAALGGVGIDEVEVLEVGRILEIAEARDAVADDHLRRRRRVGPRGGGEEEEGGDDEQARGEQGLQPPVAVPGDREGPDAGSGHGAVPYRLHRWPPIKGGWPPG